MWGAAYLIGPGFAVGVGTTVTPGAVVPGPMPAVPLLAGVPSAPVTGLGPVLLAVPLVAALIAGWIFARRRRSTSWRGLLGAATLAAPVAGLLFALAAAASGGALGSGRLAQIGPPVWPVALWGMALAAVGLFVGAAASRTLARAPQA